MSTTQDVMEVTLDEDAKRCLEAILSADKELRELTVEKALASASDKSYQRTRLGAGRSNQEHS